AGVGLALAEEAVERAGEGCREELDAVAEAGGGRVERLDAPGGEGELIAARAEGVPAESAGPFPVRIGAVGLVEGRATAELGRGRVLYLRIMEHDLSPRGDVSEEGGRGGRVRPVPRRPRMP